MTYNVELTDKPDKRGLHHVMIRLHAKGQPPARIQTEIEIEGKHWNTRKVWNKWIRSSHTRADTVNAAIVAEYTKVKTAIGLYLDGNPNLSPKQCKTRYESSSATALKEYIAPALKNSDLSYSTVDVREFEWRSFLKWAGDDLTIEQITPKLIDDYKNKLLEKGLQNSTINTYISWIRVLYEKTQKTRGVSKKEIAANSPFIDWENLVTKKTAKGRLNAAEIEKLSAAPYVFTRRGTKKGNPGRTFYNYDDFGRWCWLACLHQAGMRIGDLLRTRYESYERDAQGHPIRLRYQMQKNGRWMSIPLSNAMRSHLALIWNPNALPSHYLLPFLDNNANYAKYRGYEQIRSMPVKDAKELKNKITGLVVMLNMGLAEAVKKLDINVTGGKRLTNHTARHSFADKLRMAIKEGKSDAKGRKVTHFDAQGLLAHGRLQTTELYFGEMDQDWLDSAMDAIND